MVDSRAIGIFIDQSFVEKHGLTTHKLSRLVLVYNMNSTQNKTRQISEVVDMVF